MDRLKGTGDAVVLVWSKPSEPPHPAMRLNKHLGRKRWPVRTGPLCQWGDAAEHWRKQQRELPAPHGLGKQIRTAMVYFRWPWAAAHGRPAMLCGLGRSLSSS